MDHDLKLELPLLENITWQYDSAESLVSLISSKKSWYDAEWSAFWTNWHESVFDLRTANRFGCVVWAIILNIPISAIYTGNLPALPFGFGPLRRNFESSNFYLGAFQYPQLSLEDARRLLRVRYYAQTMSTNISNINMMLKDVFGDQGLAYIEETVGGIKVLPFGFGPYRNNLATPSNFNSNSALVNIRPMYQKYIFTFALDPVMKSWLQIYLPRGAGVNSIIQSP